MSQKEDEPLEDYIERFQFVLKKNLHHKLSEESLKLVFLMGINEYSMDALNLIGGGDSSKGTFEEILKVCRNYSRTLFKKLRGERSSITSKSYNGVSRVEISNLLSNMKQDIINHLTTQLDTLHIMKKQEEEESMLTEYCPNYRQRKGNCKCKRVVSLQQEKVEKLNFNKMEGYAGKIFYIAQRRPWQQIQGMPPNPISFNPSFPSNTPKNYAWNTQSQKTNQNQWETPKKWPQATPNWNQQTNPWPQQKFHGSNYNP